MTTQTGTPVRYWFRRQIQLANEQKMPIVIHAREADQEVMDILREEGVFQKNGKAGFRRDTMGVETPGCCFTVSPAAENWDSSM